MAKRFFAYEKLNLGMQERHLQALNVGAFMNGMLSVFCNLRSSIFEASEYTLEVTIRNEGDRALRNFFLTVGGTPGIKFKNERDFFRVANFSQNISMLRAGQSKILEIQVKTLHDGFSGELRISATPLKNSPVADRLNVEMCVAEDLRTSA